MHFYFLNSSWNQEFKFQEYFNSQNTPPTHTHTRCQEYFNSQNTPPTHTHPPLPTKLPVTE